MADAIKHAPVKGGTLISDLKSLFSLHRTKRTSAFAYGFVFAFVAFSVFLAFNPSSYSSSQWFTNIFNGSINGSLSSSSSSSAIYSDESYRSHSSSVFPHSFPNSSQQINNIASNPSRINSTRSQNITSPPPNLNDEPPMVKNQTNNKDFHDKFDGLKPNQTHKEDLHDKDGVTNPNQSAIAGQETPAPANHSTESSAKPSSDGKNSSGNGERRKEEKDGVGNRKSSLFKEQSNETNSGVPAEQRSENWAVESLMNCNLFDGEWVRDDSYPLYRPGSCSLIDEQFNCFLNGRPDNAYHKLKWKPSGCHLPR